VADGGQRFLEGRLRLSFIGTSAAVPVLSPVGSGPGGAAPVAATAAGAAGSVGGAEVAAGSVTAGAVWAWATYRRAVTPSIRTSPMPKLTNRRLFMVISSSFLV
jgi:hypothetical protein